MYFPLTTNYERVALALFKPIKVNNSTVKS